LQRQESGVLTVSTSPDFAAKWLVNRLSRFAEKHPGVDLRVSATTSYVDFARDDVGIAIRHGDGNWPGLDVRRLYSERLFPVCSPKLVLGRNRITKAADLLKYPLLRLDDAKNWTRLFQAAGVKATIGPGPVLDRASMLIDGARRSGYRAGAYGACGLGLDQRPPCAANRRFAEDGQYVLDCVPQASIESSEDCNIPELGPRRSGRRRSPPQSGCGMIAAAWRFGWSGNMTALVAAPGRWRAKSIAACPAALRDAPLRR
jgi:DNA-binding transcriptional LysR family regulator